jgi:hypothetical protein
MRVGVNGIQGPLGTSIMANAVCLNGQKHIPVDSGSRSFSLARRGCSGIQWSETGQSALLEITLCNPDQLISLFQGTDLSTI